MGLPWQTMEKTQSAYSTSSKRTRHAHIDVVMNADIARQQALERKSSVEIRDHALLKQLVAQRDRHWLLQAPSRVFGLQYTSCFIFPPFMEARVAVYNVMHWKYVEALVILVIVANCIVLAMDDPQHRGRASLGGDCGLHLLQSVLSRDAT